jgi:hypothetical protein
MQGFKNPVNHGIVHISEMAFFLEIYLFMNGPNEKVKRIGYGIA